MITDIHFALLPIANTIIGATPNAMMFSPIQDPAVALESTATITPCLNLNARVVVPWANWILTPPSPDTNGFRNSTGY